MLDKIAKGAKTLPGVALVAGALLVGGAAYALNDSGDSGDEGTVTIEQVASEPSVSETTEPAPVVATSEPAAVVTPKPVVSEVAPAPEPTTAPQQEVTVTEPDTTEPATPEPSTNPGPIELPQPIGSPNGDPYTPPGA